MESREKRWAETPVAAPMRAEDVLKVDPLRP